jgi:hypothetical protein
MDPVLFRQRTQAGFERSHFFFFRRPDNDSVNSKKHCRHHMHEIKAPQYRN